MTRPFRPARAAPANATEARSTDDMPTYAYACEHCGHKFDAFQSITAKPMRKCPACGQAFAQAADRGRSGQSSSKAPASIAPITAAKATRRPPRKKRAAARTRLPRRKKPRRKPPRRRPPNPKRRQRRNPRSRLALPYLGYRGSIFCERCADGAIQSYVGTVRPSLKRMPALCIGDCPSRPVGRVAIAAMPRLSTETTSPSSD